MHRYNTKYRYQRTLRTWIIDSIVDYYSSVEIFGAIAGITTVTSSLTADTLEFKLQSNGIQSSSH